jgi:ABC-type sulfate transport system substrate-binding protein
VRDMKETFFQRMRQGEWHRQLGIILALLLLVTVVAYGQVRLRAKDGPVRLIVYAFSTQEEAFGQGIFPAFEAAWEAETGRDLTLDGMFGPSGTLAGQINLGAPADVAIFSNAQHVTHLKIGHRVREDTQAVTIGCTPMVIVTRTGNPLELAAFSDLARPGLKLLHADPRSSGAGDWALLAEYGSAYLPSGDRAAGEAQLEAIWRNVRVLGSSARTALSLFELGAGDALVTYEQDARLALERGIELEIVVPSQTVVAQPVAIIVDDNVTADEKSVAQAFVEYLLSDAGQQIFAGYHLRPADCRGASFPPLAQSFTVDDLGGWSQAYRDLVETLWQTEIEPSLDLEPIPRLSDTGE